MDVCRFCLSELPDKDIYQLQTKTSNVDCEENYQEVLLFCLNIEVKEEDPSITKKLCMKCYQNVLDFYYFKTMALKNNAYLIEAAKAPDPLSTQSTKYEVPIDEDDIYLLQVTDHDYLASNYFESDYTESKVNEVFNYHSKDVEVKEEVCKDSEDHFSKNKHISKRNCSKDADSNKQVSKKTEGDYHSDHEDLLYYSETNEEEDEEVSGTDCEAIGDDDKGDPDYEPDAHMNAVMNRDKSNDEDDEIVTFYKTNPTVDVYFHNADPTKTDKSKKLYPCIQCDKVYSTNSHRIRHHKNFHAGNSRFVKTNCKICNKEVRDLRRHTLSMHTDPKARRYTCGGCGRVFANHQDKNKHSCPAQKYSCHLCAKKYMNQTKLDVHIRVKHNKEKRYMCQYCSKTFAKERTLLVHLRAHTGERTFICDECNKAFKCRPSLIAHMVVHIQSKDFVCSYCAKAFQSIIYLRNHVRYTHENNRRHPCKFCSLEFTRKDNCKTHEMKQHLSHFNSSLTENPFVNV